MSPLVGSITALVTPFSSSSGEIDFKAWERLLERQIEAGTQAVVVAGSTGEAAALEGSEFDALVRRAVEMAAGRIPVLAGTGQSATEKTIARTRAARASGADAALVVTPPYVRPTQEGLYVHYCAVADRGGLPIVLYNVPSRTGVDLLPETVARLARCAGIVGIKEANTARGRMSALLPLRSNGFSVLSGDDPTACSAMLAGADGCISVASNAVPGEFRRLCDLARSGANAAARVLDNTLRPLYDFLGVEPNPIPVKALLAELGMMDNKLRLPLLPLSTPYQAQCRAIAAASRHFSSPTTGNAAVSAGEIT